MIINVIGFDKNRRSEFAQSLSKEINGIYLNIDSIFSEEDLSTKYFLAGKLAQSANEIGKHVVVDAYSGSKDLRLALGKVDRVIMIGNQLEEMSEDFDMPSILDLVYNKNDNFTLCAALAAKYLKLKDGK